MGEGYEDQYHVPQQSRRDKLRALEPPQTTTLAHYSQSLYYEPTTYNCNNLMMMPNFSFSNNTGPPHHQQHGNSIYHLTNQYHLSLAHNNPTTTTTNSQALFLSLSSCQESCNDDNIARTTSCIPLGPFTGYASILKGSRFLKPAQQLLQELCFLGTTSTDHDHPHDDASFVHPSSFDTLFKSEDHSFPCVDGHKSLLISMLDEVLRSCKQYYQQMQAVLASFETVAGLSNAAPYASLALKTMSKHFNNMKNAISDQLAKAHGHPTTKGKDESPTAGQRLDQTLGLFKEHQPVWRPQRGLPERAVSILKAWLFEHFLHPYPTDSDKIMLAKQTGLSRSQVSNWFINARVRLWKPMVEEIHALEMRQAQKTSSREERNDNSTNKPSDSLHSANSLASDNPSSSSTQWYQENNPYKRNRNEYNLMHMGSNEQVSVAYNSMTSHLSAYSGGSGGVSLTLGLHQNNVISLAEPYHHINAAQSFGLGSDITSGVYVADGYEATNRHYGGYGIGGQPEFVGTSYI